MGISSEDIKELAKSFLKDSNREWIQEVLLSHFRQAVDRPDSGLETGPFPTDAVLFGLYLAETVGTGYLPPRVAVIHSYGRTLKFNEGPEGTLMHLKPLGCSEQRFHSALSRAKPCPYLIRGEGPFALAICSKDRRKLPIGTVIVVANGSVQEYSTSSIDTT